MQLNYKVTACYSPRPFAQSVLFFPECMTMLRPTLSCRKPLPFSTLRKVYHLRDVRSSVPTSTVSAALRVSSMTMMLLILEKLTWRKSLYRSRYEYKKCYTWDFNSVFPLKSHERLDSKVWFLSGPKFPFSLIQFSQCNRFLGWTTFDKKNSLLLLFLPLMWQVCLNRCVMHLLMHVQG